MSYVSVACEKCKRCDLHLVDGMCITCRKPAKREELARTPADSLPWRWDAECRGCQKGLMDPNAHIHGTTASLEKAAYIGEVARFGPHDYRAAGVREEVTIGPLTNRPCHPCDNALPATPERPHTCVLLHTHRTELSDSGKRAEYATGAVRDSAEGRGRPDLISPIMLERLSVHLERGARKYEARNWEKGLSIARCFASLFRHSWQAFQRHTDEDHLAAVVCNAMFIMHILEMIKRGRLPGSLDDLPSYMPLIPQEKRDVECDLGTCGPKCRSRSCLCECHKPEPGQ